MKFCNGEVGVFRIQIMLCCMYCLIVAELML